MTAVASDISITNDLNDLFDSDEIWRRRWILNSIPYMSETQAKDLWSNTLTDVERQSSVIVYKLLQYADVNHIFGANPWNGRHIMHPFDTAIADLPTKFRNDVQAFIAFTKQDNFIGVYGASSFDVPEQFKDNFDAMKAICSVNCVTLYRASDRLKDNEDLVFSVLFPKLDDTCQQMEALLHASDRLQKSQRVYWQMFLRNIR